MKYFLTLFLCSPACLFAQRNTPLPEFFRTLFSTNNQDSVACFRIPALATAPNGDILAVADMRVPSCRDLHANPDINIALRSSSDNGWTWSDQRVIVDFPFGQSASDPSMIVDKTSGKIFLFYNFMDLQKEPGVYYFHVIQSTDNGRTWSVPRDITAQVTKPEWHRDFQFITSGGGIQTRSGELLHCLVNLQRGTFVFGSADHGASWFVLDTPLQPADESKIVELNDSSWMVNARVNKAGCRYVHTSTDRGKTWTTRADSTLTDPGCNAGLIAHTYSVDGESKRCLLFSNPDNARDRSNLTVRVSHDDGRSWPTSIPIYPGSAAYSTMAVLRNGGVGLVFEKDNYTEMVFLPTVWGDIEKRLRLQQLMAKVKAYVEQGGDINKQQKAYYPTYFQEQVWGLGYYCDTSLFPVVTYMVQRKSPVQNPFWFTNDYCPETGHYIFRYVQLLLDNGNPVENKELFNLVDLYYFTPYGDDYPDLNDLDYYGKTPLMYACVFGNKALVRYLLKKGADKNVRSSEGKKAEAYCKTEALRRFLIRKRSGKHISYKPD